VTSSRRIAFTLHFKLRPILSWQLANKRMGFIS
jgi:hypothetical protein